MWNVNKYMLSTFILSNYGLEKYFSKTFGLHNRIMRNFIKHFIESTLKQESFSFIFLEKINKIFNKL